MHAARDRPDALLAVKHRGYRFYLADDDPVSRTTSLMPAEILRPALSPERSQVPVLTLPVGGGYPAQAKILTPENPFSRRGNKCSTGNTSPSPNNSPNPDK